MMSKKAIVLLSGGVDSATCLYLAKKANFSPFCLIFDYGQRHRKEIESAKKIARQAKAKYLVCRIDFPWKGSSLLDQRLKLPKPRPHAASERGKQTSRIPSTYVPGRNITFLSFALSYAEAIQAKAIYIGANARDFAGYPDCRPNFYRAFKNVAKTGLADNDIRISTPLLYKTKAQIIRLGQSLGVPYKLSWSCYQGGTRPCGKCSSCRFRAKGFREAGLADPGGTSVNKLRKGLRTK